MSITNALIFAAINLVSNIALYKLGQKDIIIKFHEYVKRCRMKRISNTPETSTKEEADWFIWKANEKTENAIRERDEAREIAHRFRSLYYNKLGIDGSASWFPWEEQE